VARFLAGVVSALLLTTAGLFWWRSSSAADMAPIPAPRAVSAAEILPPLADPPAASEKTREEKRFARYDRDKDGIVAREEYLASRRKAFAKLDTNGDGRISFEEYAAKTAIKYAAADKDRSGTLTPTEFATTRVVRKAKARPKPNCPPAAAASADEDG
jgi:hypothetical protein